VLDIAGTEKRDPLEDFQSLQTELRLYNPELMQRPAAIFANKMDKRSVTSKRNLERLKEITTLPIVAGSVLKYQNLEPILQLCKQLVQQGLAEAKLAEQSMLTALPSAEADDGIMADGVDDEFDSGEEVDGPVAQYAV